MPGLSDLDWHNNGHIGWSKCWRDTDVIIKSQLWIIWHVSDTTTWCIHAVIKMQEDFEDVSDETTQPPGVKTDYLWPEQQSKMDKLSIQLRAFTILKQHFWQAFGGTSAKMSLGWRLFGLDKVSPAPSTKRLRWWDSDRPNMQVRNAKEMINALRSGFQLPVHNVILLDSIKEIPTVNLSFWKTSTASLKIYDNSILRIHNRDLYHS